MKIKNLIDETAMYSMGMGMAMFGVSFAYIGALVTRKNFIAGGLSMGAGAILTHVGTQIAIGAVRRVAGKR